MHCHADYLHNSYNTIGRSVKEYAMYVGHCGKMITHVPATLTYISLISWRAATACRSQRPLLGRVNGFNLAFVYEYLRFAAKDGAKEQGSGVPKNMLEKRGMIPA